MSKGNKGPSKLDADLKQEDIIPAVVVVEDFEAAFHPLSLTKPRALLPLANVPLIEYTLEGLHTGGVDQVFIYCCCHADLIKQYLAQSRWTRPGTTMSVTVVVAEGCRSIGDVLRDLENKAFIQTDFLLVGADLVTNVKVKRLVEEFKQRRQQSKKAIMTTVYKKAPPDNLTRVTPCDAVLALRSDNQQILAYQRVGAMRKFRLPLHVLDSPGPASGQQGQGLDRGLLQVRNDLLDCHIAVCSTIVPQLMTDNFDYQSIDDLIKGVLMNDEVMDHTLHVNVLGGEDYAASARGWDTYHAVCNDVMSRYSYPLTPDSSLLSASYEDRYVYMKRNIYQHHNVTIDHSCTLERNVSVGSGSHVGDGTFITHSTIGTNCKIGKNVTLIRCHIFNGVTIEDDCHLVDSVVDEGCHIGTNTRMEGFCSLGCDITVAPGSNLVLRSSYVSEKVVKSLDEGMRERFDVGKLQKAGDVANNALILIRDNNLAEVPTQQKQRWYQITLDSDIDVEEDTTSEEDDDGAELFGGVNALDLNEADSTDVCYSELIGTLKRAFEENIAIENVVLEINSAKHAYDVQITELTMLVTKALLDLPLRLLCESASSESEPPVTPANVQKYVLNFKSLFQRFQPLFNNYVKSTSAEQLALKAIETFAAQTPIVLGAIQALVAHLYDKDCLTEEGILTWWAQGNQAGGEIRKKLVKFIEWLKTAEEEDDDDDDD